MQNACRPQASSCHPWLVDYACLQLASTNGKWRCRGRRPCPFICMLICNLQVPTACQTCTTTGVEPPASESCKEATAAVTAPQVAPQIQIQCLVISIDLKNERTPSQRAPRFTQGESFVVYFSILNFSLSHIRWLTHA